MLERIFESLYNKIFVNIVVDGAKMHIYMERCTPKAGFEALESKNAIFDGDKLTPKIVDFIESYTKESPYFYISFLDYSLLQGAIPTCQKEQFSRFHDLSQSRTLCMDNQWSCYTSLADFDALKKKYQQVGVDFLFSPFSILKLFFEDKIKTNLAMYVFVQTSSLCIAVFNKGEFLFGEYLDMHHMIEEERLSDDDLSEALLLDDEIDLEGVNVEEDELNIIDDFSDIEDLDSIEEIDEFAEHRDIEEELLAATEESNEQAQESAFNEDYQRFSLIQSSISDYYKDEHYKSDFIENLYIADSVGVSSELKRYLEEEMFLNVYIRKIDSGIELCELAKMELKR